MEYGLSDIELKKITNALNSFTSIHEAIIYGSRAKGNFKPSSDIDLTLKGDGIDLKEFTNIVLKLDDLLLPYKFDVSVYSHITNPELIEHIGRVGQIFYKASDHKVH